MFIINVSHDASKTLLHRKSNYNHCHFKFAESKTKAGEENILPITVGTFLAPRRLWRLVVRGKANGLGQGQDKLGSTRG